MPADRPPDNSLDPRERIARTGAARVRIDQPPHWWAGQLVLTSQRLFFVPEVEGGTASTAAFWLAEIAAIERTGATRILVRAGDDAATFDLTGAALAAGRRVRGWLRAIEQGRRTAIPRALAAGSRRAAG